ncbi:MAG: protein-tyrosine phosphatase family protein [Thermoplasmatota archaeon]
MWFDDCGGLTHIHANLWRSPLPELPRHFSAIKSAGVATVFSLEEAVPGQLAREAGLDWRPHFWTDDAPPRADEFDAFLTDLRRIDDKTQVVIHCRAGWGRTGSAISAALIERHGFRAKDAMELFWSRVPRARSVMTGNGQDDAVYALEARIKGRGIP